MTTTKPSCLANLQLTALLNAIARGELSDTATSPRTRIYAVRYCHQLPLTLTQSRHQPGNPKTAKKRLSDYEIIRILSLWRVEHQRVCRVGGKMRQLIFLVVIDC